MEQFVTCSQDKQVHLWDTNSHQPLWSKTIEVKTCVKIPGQEEPSSPLNSTKPELFCAAGSGEVCRFSSQWSGCGSRDHDWKVGHTSVYDAVVELTCTSSLNVCLSRLVGFFSVQNWRNLFETPCIFFYVYLPYFTPSWISSWLGCTDLFIAGGWCWTPTLGIWFLCTRTAMR